MISRIAVIVLAAGEGTRMRSPVAKVLHQAAGRSLLEHALAAAADLGPEQTVVVVGHERDAVRAHLASVAPHAVAVVQEPQLGTGHAVRTALAAVDDEDRTIVVTYGDMPLLRGNTLRDLVDRHAGSGAAVTLLSGRLDDPTGYGRVIRDATGAVTAVVEQRDADPDQLAVTEVNAGVYAFDQRFLRTALAGLRTDNAQGEEYLTDVVGIAVAGGHAVGAVTVVDSDEILGVNDRAQLAQVSTALRHRHLAGLMRSGVTVVDVASAVVDVTVEIGPDAVIEPFTILRGATTIGAGAVVGPYADLADTTVGTGAHVRAATCVGAEIGAQAVVGPYAYLRPGTRLGRGAKIGTFVEAKNAELADEAKVPHLSYVGDAAIGERTNVGAGTIFFNFDGVAKHRTEIGRDARVGGNNSLVAPVTIGDTAYTAAGSVITRDVPPGSLGVGRAQQRNVENWVERRRGGAKHTGDEQGAGE